MKKCVIALFVFALVFAASYASAEGLYLKGGIGASLVDDSTVRVQGMSDSAEMKFDTGLFLGGAIGYDLGNNVRLEGEVSYMTTDVDRVYGPGSSFDVSNDVNVLSYLVNFYYDVKNQSPSTFIIGGGIGVSNVEVDNDGYDDTVFAYQVGAGVGYATSDSVTIEVGYRYLATSNPEFEYNGIRVEAEVGSHNIYCGVRVTM